MLLGFAVSVGHAAGTRGWSVAAGLLLVTTGGGLLVEAIGVGTGLPFGQYAYGDGLGPRLADVPVIIPLAWTWMAWPAWLAASALTTRTVTRIVVAGTALAGWDLFLDPQMVAEGYWRFDQPTRALPGTTGVPVGNYAGWLAVALLMMTLLAAITRRTVASRVVTGRPTRRCSRSTCGPTTCVGHWPHGLPGPARVGAVGWPGDGAGRDPAHDRTGPPMTAWLLAAALVALAVHTIVNRRLLPRLSASTVDAPVTGVSVLLPVQDEAHHVEECLTAVLDQRGLSDLDIVVLDDGSTDGTAEVVRAVMAAHPAAAKVRLLTGQSVPDGWLGKPYACHQLAAAARFDILVFLDADVRLAPAAVATAVAALPGFELLSPYPRIVSRGAGGRLVQPLLQWSWLTFLPLGAMRRSHRPSLAAAGGQFLVLTRSGYQRAGGHAAVRGAVLEDIELARAVKRTRGPDQHRRRPGWPSAGCTRPGRPWSTATPSRCGLRSARRGRRRPVVGALLALYVGPVVALVAGLASGTDSWRRPAWSAICPVRSVDWWRPGPPVPGSGRTSPPIRSRCCCSPGWSSAPTVAAPPSPGKAARS